MKEMNLNEMTLRNIDKLNNMVRCEDSQIGSAVIMFAKRIDKELAEQNLKLSFDKKENRFAVVDIDYVDEDAPIEMQLNEEILRNIEKLNNIVLHKNAQAAQAARTLSDSVNRRLKDYGLKLYFNHKIGKYELVDINRVIIW